MIEDTASNTDHKYGPRTPSPPSLEWTKDLGGPRAAEGQTLHITVMESEDQERCKHRLSKTQLVMKQKPTVPELRSISGHGFTKSHLTVVCKHTRHKSHR